MDIVGKKFRNPKKRYNENQLWFNPIMTSCSVIVSPPNGVPKIITRREALAWRARARVRVVHIREFWRLVAVFVVV